MDRRRLIASRAAGAAVATLAAPHVTQVQQRIRWRCPGSFPKSLDTLHGTQEHTCRRVGEITHGAFQIQPSARGEIGARNARFKDIHAQWDRFRQDQQTWFRIVGDSFANSMAQSQAQAR